MSKFNVKQYLEWFTVQLLEILLSEYSEDKKILVSDDDYRDFINSVDLDCVIIGNSYFVYQLRQRGYNLEEIHDGIDYKVFTLKKNNKENLIVLMTNEAGNFIFVVSRNIFFVSGRPRVNFDWPNERTTSLDNSISEEDLQGVMTVERDILITFSDNERIIKQVKKISDD